MRRVLLLLPLLACGLQDFEPANSVSGVRIMASRADKPYAVPGDTVNIEVLAYDGRKDKSRAMRISWIPFP